MKPSVPRRRYQELQRGETAISRATHILSDGVYFGQGPRWRDGHLWFSDFLAHSVKSVSPDGDLRTLPCHLSDKGGMDGFYASRLRRSS